LSTPLAPNTSSPGPQTLAPNLGTWIIYLEGRLGNQMEQYAMLLALTRLNSLQPSSALHACYPDPLVLLHPAGVGMGGRKSHAQAGIFAEEYSRWKSPF
jgi:hypothetical protein